jgi:DNA-binding winged helix-turn-helix (wHTH) protein
VFNAGGNIAPKNGIAQPIEPQVIELLILLIENRERMISKQEINEIVWRGRIVSEAALSSRIKSARQVLGDNGRLQQFIRTIHKKGHGNIVL